MWFRLQFKRLLKRDKPEGWDSFKYSNGWFTNFRNRSPKIVTRRTTNKKHIPVEQRLPQIKKFHKFLHEVRNSTDYVHQDEVYGRFRPSNVSHFDEVPMPFVFGADETYEFEGAKRVYVKTPGTLLISDNIQWV